MIPGASMPGAVLVASLWWYSFAVLRPAQMLKAAGLYRGRELGQRPPPASGTGNGACYSLGGPGPFLLDSRPSLYQTVEAFDHLASIHDELQAPFSTPVFEDVVQILSSLTSTRSRILDCSCGAGTDALALARLVPHGEVVGLDLSAEMVSTAATRAEAQNARNVAFFQADIASLPDHFAQQFDFVYCSFSFHHYTEPVAALLEMRRVLIPGGYAFIVDAGPWWMKAIGSPLAKWGDPGWVTFYTGEEFETLFAEAGFSRFYWTEVLPGVGLSIGTR